MSVFVSSSLLLWSKFRVRLSSVHIFLFLPHPFFLSLPFTLCFLSLLLFSSLSFVYRNWNSFYDGFCWNVGTFIKVHNFIAKYVDKKTSLSLYSKLLPTLQWWLVSSLILYLDSSIQFFNHSCSIRCSCWHAWNNYYSRTYSNESKAPNNYYASDR